MRQLALTYVNLQIKLVDSASEEQRNGQQREGSYDPYNKGR
jgi:hypothetical protein